MVPLPYYLGDADPALERLMPPMAKMAASLWLITHPDLRRVTRIRAFLDLSRTQPSARTTRRLEASEKAGARLSYSGSASSTVSARRISSVSTPSAIGRTQSGRTTTS